MSDDRRYRVVLNDEEQYSIWRADLDLPAGWRANGFEGDKPDCLAHIDKVWTDMRPTGLRRRMAADAPSAARPNLTTETADNVPAKPGAIRHLISVNDLRDAELYSLVERGAEFSSGSGRPGDQLTGLVAGILFLKTSTRTRTSFSAAALRLGAQIVSFGPDDLQTNTGETLEDTAEVLSRMLDLLVVRTAGDPDDLRAFTRQKRMAVINAMTADEHPTQAVADLTTLLCHFGRIEGLRICYVGEANSTAAALALTLSRFKDVHLELRTPPGYGLAQSTFRRALANARTSGASVVEQHSMDSAPVGFDVVYTTRWQTTGSSKADPNWRTTFAPFQVTTALWDKSPDAVFLHDLPAHRGEDVTAEVLDGPRSLAFDQAGNKMYAAMAVLEWCARRR